jgi:hypothetical protein
MATEFSLAHPEEIATHRVIKELFPEKWTGDGIVYLSYDEWAAVRAALVEKEQADE